METATRKYVIEEAPRCSVCIFWNKHTLKYGVCEKIKDFQGVNNLRFLKPNTAQISMVMTHRSAVCDFFGRRSGKYISNRTKMLKAKRNNPLANGRTQKPEINVGSSILEKILQQKQQEQQ